jgi:protein-S-isoprenylcysteine O-methyltransferase Ste14
VDQLLRLLVGDGDQCQGSRAHRVRPVAACAHGFASLCVCAPLAPHRAASLAKQPIPSAWRLVLLDRCRRYRNWPALFYLGASSPRHQLESGRHREANHELITTGPYALARHPIYTGLLLGFLGSAVARGEWRGLLAVALVFAALWHKLKLEEKWMRAQFGEPYEAYSRHVAALVPYII